MSHTLDAFDLVDILEKKYKFEREDAKMLIDFKQERVATKDDLNFLSANINTRFVELENKIDSVEQKLESKIEKESTSVKQETLLLRQELVKLENKLLWGLVSGVGAVILVQVLLKFF